MAQKSSVVFVFQVRVVMGKIRSYIFVVFLRNLVSV